MAEYEITIKVRDEDRTAAEILRLMKVITSGWQQDNIKNFDEILDVSVIRVDFNPDCHICGGRH